ncbi:MAG: nucleotidyltransferase family protein [Bacteroidales bacterium]|nr:nucleotidyltransferase family protein [Bacteroidales bacterium]
MEAVILAGGLGTRLRQAVSDVPKCMAQVSGKPFLWYWLRYLSSYSITKIVLSLGYKAQTVIDWIETVRKEFPFEILFTVEDEPLGTGGAIRFALEKTTQNDVLIINGDSVFFIPIDGLFKQYKEKNPPLALALKPMQDFDRYGNVTIDENNRITSFEEKKFCKKGLINAGVYILNKQKADLSSQNEKFSFEKEVLEKRKDICGFVYDGYFIDIGIPEDYYKAQTELKENLF